jgi:WD40 repeat protein
MLKASEPFTNDLTSIDWAKSGDFLVVGDRNGYIYTVDVQTLKKQGIAKGQNADKRNAWVEDVKISPNGKWIVFGAHGGMSIDLCQVTDNGMKLSKPMAVKLGISSAITHLDWTLDSRVFVLNTQAYELMWYDAESKTRLTASGAKTLEYSTWTCVLGF